MFFWSQDRIGGEPAHIHVERDNHTAKVWLDPVQLERGGGFPASELREILRLIERHQNILKEAWDEFGR